MGSQDSEIRKKLSELKKNSESGANELVLKALDIIKLELDQIEDPNENIYAKMVDLVGQIINSRPSMAPLINTMGFILQKSESLNKQGIDENLINIEKDRLSRISSLENNFHEFLIQYAKSHCKLMLISYSSTIVNLLTKFSNYNLELYVLESRPLFEGQRTAEILSQYFNTHLIIDAAIGKFIDQIDFVLIGVDSILKDGAIINKIGTYPLASLAKINNKNVYAVCDSFKYNLRSHFDKPIIIEEKPTTEIYNKEVINNFLEIHNYYFDITPPRYISKIISDLGILDIQDFLGKVQKDLPIEWFKYFILNKKI